MKANQLKKGDYFKMEKGKTYSAEVILQEIDDSYWEYIDDYIWAYEDEQNIKMVKYWQTIKNIIAEHEIFTTKDKKLFEEVKKDLINWAKEWDYEEIKLNKDKSKLKITMCDC